jgi:hypothetical protein
VPLLNAGRLPLVPLLKYGSFEQLLDKQTGALLDLPQADTLCMSIRLKKFLSLVQFVGLYEQFHKLIGRGKQPGALLIRRTKIKGKLLRFLLRLCHFLSVVRIGHLPAIFDYREATCPTLLVLFAEESVPHPGIAGNHARKGDPRLQHFELDAPEVQRDIDPNDRLDTRDHVQDEGGRGPATKASDADAKCIDELPLFIIVIPPSRIGIVRLHLSNERGEVARVPLVFLNGVALNGWYPTPGNFPIALPELLDHLYCPALSRCYNLGPWIASCFGEATQIHRGRPLQLPREEPTDVLGGSKAVAPSPAHGCRKAATVGSSPAVCRQATRCAQETASLAILPQKARR